MLVEVGEKGGVREVLETGCVVGHDVCRTKNDLIPLAQLSARSLRPGGATALLCANVDSVHIKMLGRWKSDAMFTYLRVQAATIAHNFSTLMLQHGNYTFTPVNSNLRFLLPDQAPVDLVTLVDDQSDYTDLPDEAST